MGRHTKFEAYALMGLGFAAILVAAFVPRRWPRALVARARAAKTRPGARTLAGALPPALLAGTAGLLTVGLAARLAFLALDYEPVSDMA
jgi:hypothetical protein